MRVLTLRVLAIQAEDKCREQREGSSLLQLYQVSLSLSLAVGGRVGGSRATEGLTAAAGVKQGVPGIGEHGTAPQRPRLGGGSGGWGGQTVVALEKQRSANKGVGVPHGKGWGAEPKLGEQVWGARPGLGRGAVRAERLRGTAKTCSPTDTTLAAWPDAARAWQGLSKQTHLGWTWMAGPRLTELRGQRHSWVAATHRQEGSLSGRPGPAGGHVNTDLTPGVTQPRPEPSLAARSH